MKLREENIIRETEKALLVTVGLQSSEMGKYMVVNGFSGFYLPINVWLPKSQIVENEIPTWLLKTKLREVKFNKINDVLYL